MVGPPRHPGRKYKPLGCYSTGPSFPSKIVRCEGIRDAEPDDATFDGVQNTHPDIKYIRADFVDGVLTGEDEPVFRQPQLGAVWGIRSQSVAFCRSEKKFPADRPRSRCNSGGALAESRWHRR